MLWLWITHFCYNFNWLHKFFYIWFFVLVDKNLSHITYLVYFKEYSPPSCILLIYIIYYNGWIFVKSSKKLILWWMGPIFYKCFSLNISWYVGFAILRTDTSAILKNTNSTNQLYKHTAAAPPSWKGCWWALALSGTFGVFMGLLWVWGNGMTGRGKC